MYERSYGYLYNALGARPSTTDIAKAIRADIKTAISEGSLPARWRYSVRSQHFSGGSSIDVRVQDCADAWQPCEGIVPGSKHYLPNGGWTATGCPNVWCAARNDPKYAHAAEHHDVLTEEATVAKLTLRRIHDAYNHDGSDIMTDYFDVRYYGTVDFESAQAAAWRIADRQRKTARK